MQGAPWQWDGRVCYKAATRGHLELLKWLRSQEPPCPFPDDQGAEVLASRTAAFRHLHVLEWIIVSEPCSMLEVALRASKYNRPDVLAVLAAHDCLIQLPMVDRLAIAAGKGHLQTAKHLTPYLQKHHSSHAMFMALESSIMRTGHGQLTKRNDMEVIKWFWSRFNSFTSDQKLTLSSIIASHQSPLLVGLAACGCGPFIPWTSQAYDTAVCQGGKELLWWLLHECKFADSSWQQERPPRLQPRAQFAAGAWVWVERTQ